MTGLARLVRLDRMRDRRRVADVRVARRARRKVVLVIRRADRCRKGRGRMTGLARRVRLDRMRDRRKVADVRVARRARRKGDLGRSGRDRRNRPENRVR